MAGVVCGFLLYILPPSHPVLKKVHLLDSPLRASIRSSDLAPRMLRSLLPAGDDNRRLLLSVYSARTRQVFT